MTPNWEFVQILVCCAQFNSKSENAKKIGGRRARFSAVGRRVTPPIAKFCKNASITRLPSFGSIYRTWVANLVKMIKDIFFLLMRLNLPTNCHLLVFQHTFSARFCFIFKFEFLHFGRLQKTSNWNFAHILLCCAQFISKIDNEIKNGGRRARFFSRGL